MNLTIFEVLKSAIRVLYTVQFIKILPFFIWSTHHAFICCCSYRLISIHRQNDYRLRCATYSHLKKREKQKSRMPNEIIIIVNNITSWYIFAYKVLHRNISIWNHKRHYLLESLQYENDQERNRNKTLFEDVILALVELFSFVFFLFVQNPLHLYLSIHTTKKNWKSNAKNCESCLYLPLQIISEVYT